MSGEANRTFGTVQPIRLVVFDDGHVPFGSQVFQLACNFVESVCECIRVPQYVDPRPVDMCLKESRANRTDRTKPVDPRDGEMIDELGCGSVGNDGEIVVGDDQPMLAQVTLQSQVGLG